MSQVLDQEIAAYDVRRSELEQHHGGKWVVFRGDDLVGVFDTFEVAAQAAVDRFGRGPYLIRQVGAPPLVLPASVMCRPVHG